MKFTALQRQTLKEVLLFIRRNQLPVGYHLTANGLANEIGVSRNPVSKALSYLGDIDILSHDKNRGFFLKKPYDALQDDLEEFFETTSDPLYDQLVSLKLAGQLDNHVLESELMRLLDTSRNNVVKLLGRIQSEGWVEKKAGQGWEFLPLIDSKEAYEESYVFRLALEPALVMSPKFKVNKDELEQCLATQHRIASQGYKDMTAFELFEANCHFHESLAKWSNNRFYYQTLVKLNQLRRLAEYKLSGERTMRQGQAQEHIEILESIKRGDLLEAASLLRLHLNHAKSEKVSSL